MKDRIPTKILPNGAIRYAVYDESGNFIEHRYMLLDDEPSEPGTPFNKASFLSDATASLYGLTGDDAVVDTILKFLGEDTSTFLRLGTLSDGSFIAFGSLMKDYFGIYDELMPTRINVNANTKVLQITLYIRSYMHAPSFGAYVGATIQLFKNGELMDLPNRTHTTYSNRGDGALQQSFQFPTLKCDAGDYIQLKYIAGSIDEATCDGLEVKIR